jgi:hypothetical protein
MTKILTLLTLSLGISFSAMAEEKDVYWFYSDWNIEGMAKTEHIDTKTKIRGRYQIEISETTAGLPNIYISLHGGSPCTKDEPLPTVMKIEQQNISVISWCKKYTEEDGRYFQLTPKTDEGLDYLVNKLKKTGKFVKIDMSPFGTVYFSAKGFTREWNSHANIL